MIITYKMRMVIKFLLVVVFYLTIVRCESNSAPESSNSSKHVTFLDGSENFNNNKNINNEMTISGITLAIDAFTSNCVCNRGDVCCCPPNATCCNTPGRCCCRY